MKQFSIVFLAAIVSTATGTSYQASSGSNILNSLRAAAKFEVANEKSSQRRSRHPPNQHATVALRAEDVPKVDIRGYTELNLMGL
jgi:hypothetical protein